MFCVEDDFWNYKRRAIKHYTLFNQDTSMWFREESSFYNIMILYSFLQRSLVLAIAWLRYRRSTQIALPIKHTRKYELRMVFQWNAPSEGLPQIEFKLRKFRALSFCWDVRSWVPFTRDVFKNCTGLDAQWRTRSAADASKSRWEWYGWSTNKGCPPVGYL